MARAVPLATPGEILAEEWLAPMGISQYALAKAIGVPALRMWHDKLEAWILKEACIDFTPEQNQQGLQAVK